MQENSYTKTWLTSGAIKTLGLEFGEIRYCDVGEGPLLLLIHTLRTQLDYFQELIPLLTNRYRVIAIDLPGHGHSSIPLDARFDEPYFRQSVKDFIQALDFASSRSWASQSAACWRLLLQDPARSHFACDFP